jgi:hypothetical protein
MPRWIRKSLRSLKRSNDLAPARGLFHLLYAMTPAKPGTPLLYPASSFGGIL